MLLFFSLFLPHSTKLSLCLHTHTHISSVTHHQTPNRELSSLFDPHAVSRTLSPPPLSFSTSLDHSSINTHTYKGVHKSKTTEKASILQSFLIQFKHLSYGRNNLTKNNEIVMKKNLMIIFSSII